MSGYIQGAGSKQTDVSDDTHSLLLLETLYLPTVMTGFSDRPSRQKNHQRQQVLVKHSSFQFIKTFSMGKTDSARHTGVVIIIILLLKLQKTPGHHTHSEAGKQHQAT